MNPLEPGTRRDGRSRDRVPPSDGLGGKALTAPFGRPCASPISPFASQSASPG
jgi:hypothetical protein